MPKSFCFFTLEDGEAFSKLGVLLGLLSISLHDSLWAKGEWFRSQVTLFLLLGLPIVRFALSSVVFYLDFDHFIFSSLVALPSVFPLFI